MAGGSDHLTFRGSPPRDTARKSISHRLRGGKGTLSKAQRRVDRICINTPSQQHEITVQTEQETGGAHMEWNSKPVRARATASYLRYEPSSDELEKKLRIRSRPRARGATRLGTVGTVHRN